MPRHRLVTPRVNAHLPWPEIRVEYETTSVTVKALTDKYHLSSRNTITRMIAAQGWRRQTSLIAANDAALEVARDENRRKALEETAAAADPEVMSPSPGWEASRLVPRGDREDALDRRELIDISMLADLQSDAIKGQLAMARQEKALGSGLAANLQAILDGAMSDDPEEAAAFEAVRRRLLSLNPDKDSLTSLLKAAGEMMERAALMERRALTMDLKGSAPGQEAASVEIAPPGRDAIAAALSRLSPDAVMRLRRLSGQIAMERRDGQVKDAGG